jgi:pimeloyl-ACP methyl ester carboxylesterase
MASFATSEDGTRIAYRTSGAGPAVLLLHGAMMSAPNFSKLAAALAGDFTVHVPDRRGRGESPVTGDAADLAAEVADLRAVLAATGARRVFGLSSGAVIAFAAALEESAGEKGLAAARPNAPTIERLALYEPPFSFGDVSSKAWAGPFLAELEAGRLATAFATIVKGTGDTGRSIASLPRPLLTALMSVILRAGLRPEPEILPPRELLATVPRDLRLVGEAEPLATRAGELAAHPAELRPRVLLLGGSRSIGYLGRALDELGARLPAAECVTFDGLGHLGSDNTGKPERVAAALREFFA